MNAHNGMNDSNNNNNKNKKTKPIAVLPMAGALVGAVILLSGLSLIGNGGYHSTIAQQQNTTEGSSGNATTTGGGGVGANQSTSELRMNLEQARTALQNNDTQSAMMYLEMALSTISGGGTEGNITSSTVAGGGNATTTTTTTTGSEEAVSIGGTGVGDDYDETADD